MANTEEKLARDVGGGPQRPTDACDALIEHGELLVKIGKVLRPLTSEQRARVIKAVAALYGIGIGGEQ